MKFTVFSGKRVGGFIVGNPPDARRVRAFGIKWRKDQHAKLDIDIYVWRWMLWLWAPQRWAFLRIKWLRFSA